VTLKALSYNIRYGGLGREHSLAAVIRETAPDLVIFQEAVRPRVVERLAAETGMSHWASRPGQSLGFMSRIEIAHYEWHRPLGARHPFLEIVLAVSEFRVFGLHLSAIHSNWTERRRIREIGALLEGIKRHQEGFHALVGDFNTLAPGELLEARRLPARLRALAWLGGAIQWETIQILLNAGYVDGYRLLHPLERGFTFPTTAPHLRLDYIFLPAAFADRLKACEVIQESAAAIRASDHFPLLAHLEVL
jgi:endonuclease/exonuclease/phosphatase family metal-dependent hydrolase